MDGKKGPCPLVRSDVDREIPLQTFRKRQTHGNVLEGKLVYEGVRSLQVTSSPAEIQELGKVPYGLATHAKGLVTIHIQHDEPDTPEGRANWLPAPDGDFYLVLRLYLPDRRALDGSWQPPPIIPTT